MTRNWIAINVLILVITGLLGWQLYRSYARFKTESDPAKVPPLADLKAKVGEGVLPPLPPPRAINAAEFGVIPSQNLFSESRTMEEETKEPEVAEVPPLAVKPILVGIALSGGRRSALVVDPEDSTRGNRRSLTLRLGDSFHGYLVTDIAEDSMALESAGRREVIPLYDTSKRPSKGGKTPIVATRVVNFGVGGGSAAAQPAVVVSTPQAARSGSPVPTAPGRGSQSPARSVTISPPQQGRTTRQEGAAGAQNLSPNERIDDQGRRIIRTPFGDIVRPPAKPPNP